MCWLPEPADRVANQFYRLNDRTMSEQGMATMLCPYCGNNVDFPAEMAGQPTNCPHLTCQQSITLQVVIPEAIPVQPMPMEPPFAMPEAMPPEGGLPGAPMLAEPMMPVAPLPMAPEMPAVPTGIPVPELTPAVPEMSGIPSSELPQPETAMPAIPTGDFPQPEIPKVISPAPTEEPLEEIPLESAIGGPSLPPLPGGEGIGDIPVIKPTDPLPTEDAAVESRKEAMEELVEKYDSNKDGQLSVEELEEVKPEDQDKVDEVLVDYPALKAQLDALLEKKQSRVAAETQAESKRREAEEAMASLEIRRKEEIQSTEQALTKAANELQRLNSEIADLENSEQTRMEKDGAEAMAREENRVREEGRFNNQIRTREVEKLDVEDKSKLLEEELTNLHSKEEARRTQFDEERKALEKRQEMDERRYQDQVKLHEDTLAQAKNVHKRLGSEEEKLIEEYTGFRDKQEQGERERNLNQAKESARFEKAVASRKTAIDRFEHDSKVLEEELGEVREKDRIRKRLAAEEARRKQQAEIEEREIDVLKAEEEAQKIADSKLEVAEKIKGAGPEVESSVPRPGGPKKPKPSVKPPLPPSKPDSAEDPGKKDDGTTVDLPSMPELAAAPNAPLKPIPVKLLDDDNKGDAPALPSLPRPGDAKADLPELPVPPLPSPSGGAPKLPDAPKLPLPPTGDVPALPDLPKPPGMPSLPKQEVGGGVSDLPEPELAKPDLSKLPDLPTPPASDSAVPPVPKLPGGPPDLPKPAAGAPGLPKPSGGLPDLPKPPGASGLPKPPSLPEPPDADDPLPPPPSGDALKAEKKVLEASLQRAADKRAAMLREEEEAQTPPLPKPPGGGVLDLPKPPEGSSLPPLPKPPGGVPDLPKPSGGMPDLPKPPEGSSLPPLPKPPSGAPDLPTPGDSALPPLPKLSGDVPPLPTPPSSADSLPPLPALPDALEEEARQQTLDNEKKTE